MIKLNLKYLYYCFDVVKLNDVINMIYLNLVDRNFSFSFAVIYYLLPFGSIGRSLKCHQSLQLVDQSS